MNRDRASSALRNLRPLALAALAVFSLTLPGATPADAQGTTTLRIATLATRSSPWMRVYNAWNNTLRQRTDGRLQLQFFTGGSQGDERDVIRKIRINQLDGAAVTSTGLGQIVRRILVLQAPGVASNYRELDRARDAMREPFGEAFAGEGYKLLGWGDVGENRIFSNRPITRPGDLRSVRPWVWSQDTIFGEFLGIVGATGVRLGVPEVLPALSNGQVNAFPASATAASVLQWHTGATHVTQQSNGILIGATILSSRAFDGLDADLQAALLETSDAAHRQLVTRIRRDDQRYYRVLTERHGITPVDLSEHQDEWDCAAYLTRNRLAGQVYPAPLMQQVMRAAGANPNRGRCASGTSFQGG